VKRLIAAAFDVTANGDTLAMSITNRA